MSMLDDFARRWTGRLGVTAFVVAALALGRAIGADLPQPDQVLGTPHTRTAEIGQEVPLKRATVTVTDLRLARTLEDPFGGQPLRTPGIYLVADLVATATDADAVIGKVQAQQGSMVWEPARGGLSTCRVTPPGVPQACQVAVEVPVDQLAGMTLLVSPAPHDIRFEDALVIDPGFTESDAEAAAASLLLADRVLGPAALDALDVGDGLDALDGEDRDG